jgi:triosephosphate isomerase (TIM)
LSKRHYTIIGNWKMYFPFTQSIEWIKNNTEMLQELQQQTRHNITLCPSYDSLSIIAHELKSSSIAVGAQDCSNHKSGAYTGQVSAKSLAEIGCLYCIIGHSESRRYQQETSVDVAQKMQQLLQNYITPILCIGETQQEYEQELTCVVLEKQLAPIGDLLQAYAKPKTALYIAYEPIWAIGSGIIPENDYLKKVYHQIKDLIKNYPNNDAISLLYGGSVNGQTISRFKQVPEIKGFLIGSASTDFQELKKIVLSI